MSTKGLAKAAATILQNSAAKYLCLALIAFTSPSAFAKGKAISVSISPTSATVATGGTQQFTATVSGTSNKTVTWLVNSIVGGNSTVGTVSTSGLYTAPAAVPSASITVTAQSVADLKVRQRIRNRNGAWNASSEHHYHFAAGRGRQHRVLDDAGCDRRHSSVHLVPDQWLAAERILALQ